MSRICVSMVLAILVSTCRSEIPAAILEIAPAETAVIIEVPAPMELLERLMTHPARRAIEALPQYQQAIQTPQYAMALAARVWFEGQLGATWQEAFKVAVGDGLYLLANESGVVVIGKSPQPERLQRLVPLLAKLAAGGANSANTEIQPVHQAQGIDVYKIGDALACRAGDYLFVSGQPKLLGKVVMKLRAQGTDRALPWEVPAALANASADVRWYGKLDVIPPFKKPLRGAREPIKDPGLALLVAGIFQAVSPTGSMAGQLRLTDDSLAIHNFVESDCDSKKTIPPLVAVCFGDQLATFAPEFELKELKPLARLGTVRDLGRFWLQRGEFLTSQAAAQLDVADSQLSTVFGGFDFGDEILGASAAPILTVAVSPRDDHGQLLPGYPMLAGILQFKKDRQDAADRYRLAFQSAVSLSNVQRAQNGGIQWGLVSDRSQGFDVVSTRPFFTKSNAGSATGSVANNWAQQQLPTIATNERFIVVASHRRVAEQIMHALLQAKDPTAEDAAASWQTSFTLDGREAFDWLEKNREMLVAQSMLEKGHAKEAAATEVATLIALVRNFEQFQAQLRLRDGWLEHQAVLRLAVEGTPP